MIMASIWQLVKSLTFPSLLLATFCIFQTKSEELHSSFVNKNGLNGEDELWFGDDHDVHSRVRRADLSAIKDKYDADRLKLFSSSDKEEIVAKHNEYRKAAGASNMEYMIWDDDLENTAGLWASVCFWGHGHTNVETQYNSVGQNMWLGQGRPNGKGAVRAWHDNEIYNYMYDEAKCKSGKVCGHYTQVVWAKSTRVGCGRAYCAATIRNTGEPDGRTSVWILVCDYAPAGNYRGVRPFLKGPPCTECTSGKAECYDNYACRPCSEHNERCDCRQECHNCGTVTAECRCECKAGWHGQSCDTACEDTDDRCGKSPGWPSPVYCSAHEAIPKNCPLMCSVCEPSSGPQDGKCVTDSPATASLITTAPKPACKKTCKNKGTLQSGCLCKCREGYTGERCERLIEEVKRGVEIIFAETLASYNAAFESKLFASVASLVTVYCNNNFRSCCSSDQEKKSGTFGFVTTNDIQIAEGYPVENEVQNESTPQFITMVIVKVPSSSDLCENGAATTTNRRRRGVEQRGDRERRADSIYLQQSMLLDVIQDNMKTIATDVNVTVESVRAGEVTPTKSGGSGTSPGAVAAIIIVVLLVVVGITVVVVILIVKRLNNLKNKTADRGSGWADKDGGDQKVPPEEMKKNVQGHI